MREVKFRFNDRIFHCAHIIEWLKEQNMYFELIRINAGAVNGIRILESDATLFYLTWCDSVIHDGYFQRV